MGSNNQEYKRVRRTDSKPEKTRGELIIQSLQLQNKLQEEELRIPRIFTTDVTPESCQNELLEQKGRTAILTDEGNFFDVVSGLYSNGRANFDVFLQGHARGTIRIRRKDRDVQLNNIAVSLGLAVQPAVLSELADKNNRVFRGKGLLARFKFCVPKSNIGQRDIRRRVSIDLKAQEAYMKGVKALLDVPTTETPQLLTLSKSALASWEDFAQWIEDRQGDGGEYERLQDFTGKLPGEALRIAGLCHIASQVELSPTLLDKVDEEDEVNGQELITDAPLSALSSLPINRKQISKQTIEPVLALSKKLIAHAEAALNLLGDDLAITDAKYSFKWLLNNTERNKQDAFYIKQNALHNTARFKNSKLERVTKALDILRERHIISPQCKLPTKKPTLIYYVNPAVMNKAELGELY